MGIHSPAVGELGCSPCALGLLHPADYATESQCGLCPTGAADGESHDRFQKIFQVEVSYFVVAECYALDNSLASPPVVFAVGDAYRGSRLPSPQSTPGSGKAL